MATFDDFNLLDIRVGQIVRVEPNIKARKPSYKIWVDLGEEIGMKQTSAQLTHFYQPDDLMHRQVLCVINFPSKLIAGFKSELLILGVYHGEGVILVEPDRPVALGDKLG